MDVKFSEPAYARAERRVVRAGAVSRLVIKAGLAKDEAGAQKVLLIVFVLAVLASLLVLVLPGNTARPPSPEVFEGME